MNHRIVKKIQAQTNFLLGNADDGNCPTILNKTSEFVQNKYIYSGFALCKSNILYFLDATQGTGE